MKEEYKQKYAVSELNLLEKYHKEKKLSFPLTAKDKENLVNCAMLAIKMGEFKFLTYLLEQEKSILAEKESGIFRMTADIVDFIVFKNTIDYLFDKDKENHININAHDNGFLKEIIKKNKINYLEYIVDKHSKTFNLEDNLLFKILVRNQNKEVFDYFIFDLNMPVTETEDIKKWLLENDYEEQLIQIQKRNLFNQLQSDLKDKTFYIKAKKT